MLLERRASGAQAYSASPSTSSTREARAELADAVQRKSSSQSAKGAGQGSHQFCPMCLLTSVENPLQWSTGLQQTTKEWRRKLDLRMRWDCGAQHG